jgi:hypothetical protein
MRSSWDRSRVVSMSCARTFRYYAADPAAAVAAIRARVPLLQTTP